MNLLMLLFMLIFHQGHSYDVTLVMLPTLDSINMSMRMLSSKEKNYFSL